MRKKILKNLLILSYLISLLLFGDTSKDIPNEIIDKNPNKKIETIIANKNKEFANLDITINKLKPIQISPSDVTGGNIVFEIPKEYTNYTYFVTSREEEIPHKLTVNNKEITSDRAIFNENIEIGIPYKLSSIDNKDIITISSSTLKDKNIFISIYDKNKKDVLKIYQYERRIRSPRYLDAPFFGTIYLGAIKPGFRLYRNYQIAENLWWFYQAKGGREWASIEVKNIDGLDAQPLNRKFLDRVFLGASYDFIGRATFTNINDLDTGQLPKFKTQIPVNLSLSPNGGAKINVENIQEHYLDNGYYPGWKANGIIETPRIRSFWRHGVFQATDIWYSVYLQIEYLFENINYIAGMYEIDNTGGKAFYIQVGADLTTPLPEKNPLYEKIQFLLQRGVFEVETTVKKSNLSTLNGGKLVKFIDFKGYLKEKFDETLLGDKEKSLYYAEYGGNYTVETKGDINRQGIKINKTNSVETSGIIIPEPLGTGLYTVELRYKNEYGDYLQYDLNGGNINNYDTFKIKYLDNRDESEAELDLSGLPKNTYGIWDKDGTGNLNSKSTNSNKTLVLKLKEKDGKQGQIINTVNTNSINEKKSQKVSKLKVTRKSDNKVFEEQFSISGQRAVIAVEDISLGFDKSGDFIVQKNSVVTGEDSYIIEPFDNNDLPLGKMTLKIIKDSVENVGDLKYSLDQLLILSNVNGWLKLDGSFSENIGSANNSLLEKMIKNNNVTNNQSTLNKINIKSIVSVGDYTVNSNIENFIKNRKYIQSLNDKEVFSSFDNDNIEGIIIKKGTSSNISDLIELNLQKNNINDNKVIKVIYIDNMDQFKSFRIFLDVSSNTYQNLKYEVNMSRFNLNTNYEFLLTSSSFNSDNSVSETNNSDLKIRKTFGNTYDNGRLLGFRTVFKELSLKDITFKIDDSNKSNSISLNYTTENYSLDFKKSTDNLQNIKNVYLNVNKLKREFREEKATLKYLYNDLIPLGEIELTLNSSSDDFTYGEGFLDLNELMVLMNDNGNINGSFWFLDFPNYQTNSNKNITYNKETFERTAHKGTTYGSRFEELPWRTTNYNIGKPKIEIMNGDLYNFYKNGRFNIDKLVITKNNTIIDTITDLPTEFKENTAQGFSTPNSTIRNYSTQNLKFGTNSNGGLRIGGFYQLSQSGIYRLNFYSNNIKKGEFVLHVYEGSNNRPILPARSDDTLIIEIDKRIKQLFKYNEQIQINNILDTPSILSRNSSGSLYNETVEEFINIKTLTGNKSNLFNFLRSAITDRFQPTNELTISNNLYRDKKYRPIIDVGSHNVYIHKDEIENSDEITRNLYYKDKNIEKSIRYIIRFVGDDKQTITKSEDVSNITLGEKLTSTQNIDILKLFMFNTNNFNGSKVTSSISGKTTAREYVKLVDNKTNSNKNISFDIYRYTKAFLTEERIYTIKYKDIELQDVKFSITNKGTEGSANIDMSSNNVGIWDNFIENSPKSKILTGVLNHFTLTNIEGDIIDTRITTGNISNVNLIQNNTKKLYVSDDKGNLQQTTVNKDTKIQVMLGSLQIGIEGATNLQEDKKKIGFLFIDKKNRDYIPKIITIIAKDEHDNILSKFTLYTIVDKPKSVGKITLTISDKLYKYMSNTTNPLMYINKDGKIASTLNNVDNGEDYNNFVKINLSEITDSNLINNNHSISWKDEIPDRKKIKDKVHSQKYSQTEPGIELPDISKFSDLKNGNKLPKTFLELNNLGIQSDELTFINNSNNSIPFSFIYEIIKDTDVAENIYGTINTFSIPENKKVTFSTTQKTNDNSTLNISDFLSIKSGYSASSTYNVSDYNFINNSQKTTGETIKNFSIYKLNMVYNGKDKNEISIEKTNNLYKEPFQEIFDVYYKNIKLGTYYLTFENTPPVYNGSSSLNLTDFGINTSTSWTNSSTGKLTVDNNGKYSLTDSSGEYPYANVEDLSKLQITVRKKGSSEKPQTLSLSGDKFEYIDKINNTPVLKLEFYNNGKSIKISKLSELNDNSTTTTYEITFNYVDKSKNTNKNLGKYEFSIIRNEKDLGKIVLQAVPNKIVNPLIPENGKYREINNGTFENDWKIISFDKQREAENIKVKNWLKLNETSPLSNDRNKFVFSNNKIETNLGFREESITFKNNTKNLLDLIKTAKYEYMLPERYKLDSNNRPISKNTFVTFIDENDKYYKLEIEYRYDLIEKQNATAKFVMTELNEEEFVFTGDSSSKSTISEKNNKKDNKGKIISLTEVNGFLNYTFNNEYKMKIFKNGQEVNDGITDFKYSSANYDVTIDGNNLKIKKKMDNTFEDTLEIKILAFEGNKEIIVGELTLTLKNESKFAIKGDKILDFGIISYSPYDTTNLAKGEKTFTITGARDKNIEFVLNKNETEITNTANNNAKIKVSGIKVLNPKKNLSNTDEYFFTIEAFAETTPNMIPGTYTGEIDVIINIIP